MDDTFPFFAVTNHHTPSSGRPPSVSADEPGAYHGYFENRHGEQFVFVYRHETREAVLWCGDAGWGSYAVVDGRVESLILSSEESTWLRACWEAATFDDRPST